MTHSYFSLSAVSRPEIRRSMSELPALERVLDEIEAHRPSPKVKADPGADLVADDFDADAIWANRREGRSTATRASTLTPVALEASEIARRLCA